MMRSRSSNRERHRQQREEEDQGKMKIKLIRFDGFKRPPVRMHDNDAGADVWLPEPLRLNPHKTMRVPLGFGLELPDGFMANIYPRSSLAADGVICQLPPIDAGYRGEISAIVTNMNRTPAILPTGTRIGQIVVVPVVYVDFVDELDKKRGAGGFGSTGAGEVNEVRT